jgi:hypothetical protein
MQSRRVLVVVAALIIVVATGSVLSCGSDSTEPHRPGYSVIELYSGNVAATDSTSARAAFQAFLIQSGGSAGTAPFRWTELEYRRSFGREEYNGSAYWGVVARGLPSGGSAEETTQFRVRQDGEIVQMIGNI